MRGGAILRRARGSPGRLGERLRDAGERGVQGVGVVEPQRDDEVVGRGLGGTSKPIPASTSRFSSVAIATWAAATPGRPWTVRLTWSSVTESANAPGRSSTWVVMRPAPIPRPASSPAPEVCPMARSVVGGLFLARRAERGDVRRELGDHLAVHRAVEQRRRQARGAVQQVADRGVDGVRGVTGRPVHGQPAAQHVVAVRRQPVAGAHQLADLGPERRRVGQRTSAGHAGP